MAERLTDIREGMVLGGEYEIIPASPQRLELGAGAMGAVYLAKDKTIGRVVVIKTIRTANLKSHKERVEYLERFQKEAIAAGMCNHPNLVTLYRTVFDDPAAPGIAWYAMEHIPHAVDLAEHLDQATPQAGKSTVPFQEIEQFLTDAALGLREVHSHNIVHRDIKLNNYLVYPTPDGFRYKLLDFGVARYPESNLTMTAHVLGTPAYMSPERARSYLIGHRHETTPSDDLFAIGVVAYILITGDKPWRTDGNFPDLMHLICETPPPDLFAIRPDTPQGLAHVVLRLLEKFARDRYPSAQALLDDVRRMDTLGPYTQVPIALGGARARLDTATAKLGPLAEKSLNVDVDSFLAQQPETPAAPSEAVPADAPAEAAEDPPKIPPQATATAPEPEVPGLAGDAVDYAALPASPPVKSPFRTLPRQTRFALVAGAAVLAGLLLVLLFSLSRRGNDAPVSSPLLDEDAMASKPMTVTPEEMVALERRSQQQKLLDAERERRARATAANPPQTPDVDGDLTGEESRSHKGKGKARARRIAAPTASGTTPSAAAPTLAANNVSIVGSPPPPPPPAAPDPTPRRQKNPEDMVAASTVPAAGARAPGAPAMPALGLAIDTKMEVRLTSAISSDTPDTLVVAVLDKPFRTPAMKAPLAAGAKLFGKADFRADTNRVALVFTKLQLPSGAVYAIQAQAVETNGQAGLAANVAKRDQRGKANAGEAAVDVVEAIIGDAPGSRATGRWSNDKRTDAQDLRNTTTTLSLPLKKRFLVQFLQAV